MGEGGRVAHEAADNGGATDGGATGEGLGARGDWFLGVDIGGTFTDVVLAKAGGAVVTRKAHTTADDPVEGALAGVTSALAEAGIDGGAVGRVVHATTLATNLVLEGAGARVALATTEGFGDLIRVPRGGGAIIDGARTLAVHRPPNPLVPRWMTVEVPERMDAAGAVLRTLEPAAARQVAEDIAALEPEAVAVCLLHAYVDDRHERAVADQLSRVLPDVPVYVSSDVSPTIREYGRAVSTVVSAYVGPTLRRYLSRFAERLALLGITGPIHIMESSGGVMSLEQAMVRSASTLESGPAAGVIATRQLWQDGSDGTAGRDLLSFDMGGTTAKCGIVREGAIDRRFELWVGGKASRAGRQGGGWPVRIPVADLAEIGAGGGSIAWVDEAGDLRVGPQSAGSSPGPACYGRGGTRPTVTDANVVLGYVHTERFAGGLLALDPERSVAAIVEGVAKPLGLPDALDAAALVFDLVNANMAGAIRMMTIERGLDPRDFDLVSFGGAGPLHVARLAQAFGMERVVVPAHPGVRSAVGLLGTDLSVDEVQSCRWRGESSDVEPLRRTFEALEERAAHVMALPGSPGLAAAGGSSGRVRCIRRLDVRYVGQAHALTVPLPEGDLDVVVPTGLGTLFGDQYEAAYGVRNEGPFEVVACRVQLEQAVPTWAPPERVPAGPGSRRGSSGSSAGQIGLHAGQGGPGAGQIGPGPGQIDPRAGQGGSGSGAWRAAVPSGRRLAWFAEAGGQVEAAVHQWAELGPSDLVAGPALVDGQYTTVVVPPGWEALCDPQGNVRVTVT